MACATKPNAATGSRTAGAGRPQSPAHESLSACVQRWSTAAHRHRPRAGAPAQAGRLRRTGFSARRVDPGASAQPAQRPPERVRAGVSVIAHDLGVVEHISDRVAVMYLGRIVELAPAAQLYDRPSIRTPRRCCRPCPRRAGPAPPTHRAPGRRPQSANPPSGCAFHPRCRYAQDICRTTDPELAKSLPGRWQPVTSRTRSPWLASSSSVAHDTSARDEQGPRGGELPACLDCQGGRRRATRRACPFRRDRMAPSRCRASRRQSPVRAGDSGTASWMSVCCNMSNAAAQAPITTSASAVSARVAGRRERQSAPP